MLPIGPSIPHDTTSLRLAIASGIAPLGLGADAIAIDGDFPSISSLKLDLTGARFTRDLRAEKAGAERQPGFFARSFAIRAAPANVEKVPFHLTVDAEDVVFAFARTDSGAWGLTIDRAARGDADLRVTNANLESALLVVAKEAAEKKGAEILSVRLHFTSTGPCELAMTATVEAKAMFFTAKVIISGRIEISSSLEATLSGLSCQGDGMLGNMAAGFLRPQFAKLEGRAFPLASFVPGLRDASVEVTTDGLRIRATLGS